MSEKTLNATGLLRRSLDAHMSVVTGTIANESSWLYDVGRANDFLKAALAGDNSMEDDRLALGLKYKSKTKE